MKINFIVKFFNQLQTYFLYTITRMDKIQDFYFLHGKRNRCFQVNPFGITLYEIDEVEYIHKGVVDKLFDALLWIRGKTPKNIIQVYSKSKDTR